MGNGLLRALPPVGSPVPLLPDAQTASPDLGSDGAYAVHYVDSGTSALALALGFARHRRRDPAGTALLPAYGCPDLVAATQYAGVPAQLVDVDPDTPWLSPVDLSRRISGASAVVAVNFLGMPERFDSLATRTRGADVTLIEDSAQMAPRSAGWKPRGDLVIYSFGRGKPLSLLAGGALLVRNDWADEFNRWLPALNPNGSAGGYLLKCAAYNAATRPRLFGLARRLPFLRLGEVRYSPLKRIDAMAPAARTRLGGAFARLPTIPSTAQRALDAAFESLRGKYLGLPAALRAQDYPLLRYPVLARDAEQRDSLVAELDAAGLGASAFYGRALAEIPGVPGVGGAQCPEAASFAKRLFTLPVHSGVTPRDVESMISILGGRA